MVNFKESFRMAGAMLKAIWAEGGMIAFIKGEAEASLNDYAE